MKLRIALLGLLLVVVSANSLAQIRDYGIKFGAVAARQTWQYTPDTYHRPTVNRWGVDVGLFVEWLNSPFVSILTEAHFTVRGMAEEFQPVRGFPVGTGGLITFSREIDYLSLPLLLKLRYEVGTFDVFGLAGPRLDVKLGTREQPDLPYEGFRDLGTGFTFGGGILMNHVLSNQQLGLEFRFSPSFGSEYSTPSTQVTSKSMELLVLIGL